MTTQGHFDARAPLPGTTGLEPYKGKSRDRIRQREIPPIAPNSEDQQGRRGLGAETDRASRKITGIECKASRKIKGPGGQLNFMIMMHR